MPIFKTRLNTRVHSKMEILSINKQFSFTIHMGAENAVVVISLTKLLAKEAVKSAGLAQGGSFYYGGGSC